MSDYLPGGHLSNGSVIVVKDHMLYLYDEFYSFQR